LNPEIAQASSRAAGEAGRSGLLHHQTDHTGLPRVIAVVVTLASALVFYALLTHGTFSPLYEQDQPSYANQFFAAQAHAVLHGHLNVSPAQIPGECWVSHGRCYGYFGLTPSLLRLPILWLIDSSGRSFTAVYMTAALALAIGSALAIAFRALATVRRTRVGIWLGVVLAVGLGPASILAAIARPAVYEEAIAWSVAFGLFGVYCFLRWWSDGSRGWAALLVSSLVLGANARPTIVPLALALGAGIVIRGLLERRKAGRTRRVILFGVAVMLLPLATCLGVFWLKFHTPLPSTVLNQNVSGPTASPYWLAVRRVDHDSLVGLRFVPTTLLAYLRPDGVALTSAFPFVNFRFVPGGPGGHLVGIPPGSIVAEPWTTITDDMPLAVAIVLAGCVYGLFLARRRGIALRAGIAALVRSPMTYCLLGTIGASGVMLIQCGMTNRYLGDAFPLVAVAVAGAARLIAPSAARLSGRTAVVLVVGATLLVAWSLLFNLGIEYQDWWHKAV
jgi:hypothetical protein